MIDVRRLTKTRAQLDEATRLLWPLAPPRHPTWCLFGSAVMQLHGLRGDIADVDVAVDHTLWERLARTVNYGVHVPRPDHPPYLEGYEAGAHVHVFYAWRPDEPEVDLVWCRRLAERVGEGINAWPCAPLVHVRAHKLGSIKRYGSEGRWAKHVADVEAIDNYIATGVVQ